MALRDKQDIFPAETLLALNRLLDLHKFADNPRSAYFALGLLGLGLQDREYVDIHGGIGGFGQLRNWQDCNEDDETVNFRVFLDRLRNVSYKFPLPFTDTYKPQVLTVEGNVPGFAEGPYDGPDVLLWDAVDGVHWGPPLVSSSTLPTSLVWGDQNYVVAPVESVWGDVPEGYTWFRTLQHLQEWCNAHQFFGQVTVWLKGPVNGSLELPTVRSPFYVRLRAPDNTQDDTLTVRRTRVYLDGGDTSTPVPYHSPRLQFEDCHLDPRSFVSVVEGHAVEGNFLRFIRCTGAVQVFGEPSTSVEAELVEVRDSTLVINMGAGSMTERYRRLHAVGSVLTAAVTRTGVDSLTSVLVDLRDSVLQTALWEPTAPSYWGQALHRTFAYNHGRRPLFIDAVASELSLNYLSATKQFWSPNFSPAGRPLRDPLIHARASRVSVLNIGDPGNQDNLGFFDYNLPLIASQSALIGASTGSLVIVGLDRQTDVWDLTGVSAGFYIQRHILAAMFGELGMTPVTNDGTATGVFVDLREPTSPPSDYPEDQQGVVTIPPGIVEVDLLSLGAF